MLLFSLQPPLRLSMRAAPSSEARPAAPRADARGAQRGSSSSKDPRARRGRRRLRVVEALSCRCRCASFFLLLYVSLCSVIQNETFLGYVCSHLCTTSGLQCCLQRPTFSVIEMNAFAVVSWCAHELFS